MPRLQKHILRTLRKADKIIVLNEDVRTYFANYDIEMDIVSNAVPILETAPMSDERTQISCFGQLGERKGTYDLLRIAKVLYARHPEVMIYLYGDGDLKEVQELVIQQELKNIRIGGWITADEKALAMRKTMIHVLPSYQEGLPMSVLETMAYGIPNVSTYVGGIPDVIESGKDGLLINPGEEDALAEALISLIEQETIRKKNGHSSRSKN